MASILTLDPPGLPLPQQLREINEALLVSSVRQHELAAEAKEVAAKLRESEARYRTLFDLVPVAVYSCDASGVIRSFNRRCVELWGREPVAEDPRDRFCGAFRTFYPDGTPIDRPRGPTAQVLNGKRSEVRDAEVLIERSDGSQSNCIVNIRPIRSAGGEITGAINCFYDITERKRLQDKLHGSEQRYRRLFETSQDGILILDFHSGEVIDANQFMTDLLGYSLTDFRGKAFLEIGLFKDRAASETMMLELQRSGNARYENLPLETDGGRRVEVEVIANVYDEGTHKVIQCNIRDITDRSRLEKQAYDQSAALSDLHRRKDEFLAMLSHELRNPLAPIANAVRLLALERGGQSPIAQQACAIIERQVGQLKHLVDDLLEISRISTGRIQLRQERITVSGVVERAVETAFPLIEQRRHALTVIQSPEPLWVYADAARLEQVVVNLLNNAAKYTDEGGKIWLTVESAGEECLIRVRDTGVGIAAETLPRIFDLFTQVDHSLDRSQGGLGIGLSLVQRLVELHGGTVVATSVVGEGSEFVVRLPMVVFSAIAVAVPPVAAAMVQACRVLVVDDNVDSAESLAMLLKVSGHETKTAYDGPTAVVAALGFKPDVVLLDIGLPGLNGFEVARRIRLQPANAKSVLVAMTGYGQDTDRQRSQEAGFDHHLTKPADFAKVKAILAAVAAKAS